MNVDKKILQTIAYSRDARPCVSCALHFKTIFDNINVYYCRRRDAIETHGRASLQQIHKRAFHQIIESHHNQIKFNNHV
jgi:hypothetical protein